MLRETKVFECFNADDIYDAVEYVNNRTDGGRTVIKLSSQYAPYIMSKPLHITTSYGDMVTFDMGGLTIKYVGSTDNWTIVKEGG